jgi:hypothetical protein
MSQLSDILTTNAECLAMLRDRPETAMADSPYRAVQSALGRAREALIRAAFRQGDTAAIATLTPNERRAFSGAESNPATPENAGALDMKDSKLVKKAKKLKSKNPNASTSDVFYGLADDAPVGSIQREALSVAGSSDAISKMRRKAGLR